MTLPKPSVVVVDDEENILKTMGICLESAGFDVSLFRDPGQAAPAFKNRNFDLAFIDLKMAPMDGLQLLEIVKRDSPSTTVVIITAHGSIDSAIEAVKKGLFSIYTIDYMEEGLEMLTGLKAGDAGEDGAYPEGTINYLVEKRLTEISEALEKKKEKENGDNEEAPRKIEE